MAQTNAPHRRIRHLVPAAWYVGLVSACSIAYDAMGWPDILAYVLLLTTFPGAQLAFLLLLLLSLAFPDESVDTAAADAAPGPFDSLPLYAAGAVANVLLVWGFTAFVRLLAREARRSRAQ